MTAEIVRGEEGRIQNIHPPGGSSPIAASRVGESVGVEERLTAAARRNPRAGAFGQCRVAVPVRDAETTTSIKVSPSSIGRGEITVCDNEIRLVGAFGDQASQQFLPACSPRGRRRKSPGIDQPARHIAARQRECRVQPAVERAPAVGRACSSRNSAPRAAPTDSARLDTDSATAPARPSPLPTVHHITATATATGTGTAGRARRQAPPPRVGEDEDIDSSTAMSARIPRSRNQFRRAYSATAPAHFIEGAVPRTTARSHPRGRRRTPGSHRTVPRSSAAAVSARSRRSPTRSGGFDRSGSPSATRRNASSSGAAPRCALFGQGLAQMLRSSRAPRARDRAPRPPRGGTARSR